MKIRLPIRKPGPPLKRPPQLKLKASVARSRRAPAIEEEDFLEEPEPNMRLSHAFVVVLVLHVIAVAGVFAFNSIKARQADIFSAVKDEPAKSIATADPSAANASDPTPSSSETSDPSNGGSPSQPAPAAQSVASATPSAVAGAKTHELQPGETLTKIATTYGVSITDLEKANNISDPTKIRAGTVLTIRAATSASAPSAAKSAAAEPSAKTSEPAAPVASGVKDSGKVYVVVKGDNPVRIAKRLKVSYAGLLSLNGITDPRKIPIGQKLKIPAAASK